MGTLGLIARADDGGLGTQAWELARHLQPDKVLVVDVHPRRGDFHMERYYDLGYAIGASMHVAHNPIAPELTAWLCDGLDGVIAPETFYLDDRVMQAGVGTRLLLLVNPELFVPSYQALANRGVIEVFAPTTWETERLGKHVLLPQPVARDRIRHVHRTGSARTFLHVSSPAMLDRNGTQLVRAALEQYEGPDIRLLVAGDAKPAEVTRYEHVTVYPLPHVPNYFDLWSDDVDVLLQPRRYGGLNMLQLEAAAAGIPTICLDRDPERTWGGACRVAWAARTPHKMKGGTFPVYDADPALIMQEMRHCADGSLTDVSAAADEWAEQNAWHTLLPEWLTALT